jgi:hypothetical protein
MSEHTPGPWKWHRNELIGARGRVLHLWHGRYGSELHIDNDADSSLIESAPELLRECEWALAKMSKWPQFEDALDDLRAAIAKARGES